MKKTISRYALQGSAAGTGTIETFTVTKPGILKRITVGITAKFLSVGGGGLVLAKNNPIATHADLGPVRNYFQIPLRCDTGIGMAIPQDEPVSVGDEFRLNADMAPKGCAIFGVDVVLEIEENVRLSTTTLRSTRNKKQAKK